MEAKVAVAAEEGPVGGDVAQACDGQVIADGTLEARYVAYPLSRVAEAGERPGAGRAVVTPT